MWAWKFRTLATQKAVREEKGRDGESSQDSMKKSANTEKWDSCVPERRVGGERCWSLPSRRPVVDLYGEVNRCRSFASGGLM